ncbi:MAG TPA: nucleotide sugar dehydrogenase, partial [Puia sp.]|nr:nucleotide sugar dehydrogenase [Puia sp.]
MRITVTGLGYLGIVHSVAMAELGHHVLAMDIDKARVKTLSGGTVPVSEPGLQEMWARHLISGNIHVTLDEADLPHWGNVHFMCTGTPVDDSGKAELSYIFEAVEALAVKFPENSDHFIIGKSTVPPGTGKLLLNVARREAPDSAYVDVAWNPEFLREGTAVSDSLYPDRHVFGVSNHRARIVLEEIYKNCASRAGDPVITDVQTAELSKLAANAFIATKISFINAFSDLSAETGASAEDLSKILSLDTRIGPGMRPGLGFGGGCLPKDLEILMDVCTHNKGYPLNRFIRQVQSVNLLRTERARELAYNILGSLQDKKIVILGASFKPGTDDIRESPGLHLARSLSECGADVTVCDPLVKSSPGFRNFGFIPNAMFAMGGADLVVLATEHPEYARIDPLRLSPGTIIDGRFALD